MGERAVFFHREGATWHPKRAAIGPWSPKHLHGGPVAALCAAVAQETLGDPALLVTRLTLELVRPVPVEPIEIEARVLKRGRRLNLVDITLGCAGTSIAHARLQLAGKVSFALPALAAPSARLIPPADAPEDFEPMDLSRSTFRHGPAPFLMLACEVRSPRPEGLFGQEPTDAWLKIDADLTPGEPLSKTGAVLAAADCGNALGSLEPPGTFTRFPNADLSVYLAREPASAWVRMAPTTTWLDHGIGHTRCALADRLGMLGTSAVTVILDRLPN